MEALKFGDAESISKAKEERQILAIDRQIEALQDALYDKDNLSDEHAKLLDFLEGTTAESIESIIEGLEAALDHAVSSLKDI